jgi:hypothetical protein
MTRRGNNGGEATADTSGESPGSELTLRADNASVSASRQVIFCKGLPVGWALSQGVITEGSTHSLCTFPKLITPRSPAVRGARYSYGSETFRRSEPQASEAVSGMLTIKIQRSEGEPAHSGEPSGHEREKIQSQLMPATFER